MQYKNNAMSSTIIDDIIFGNKAAKECANCGKEGEGIKLPIKCCQDGICHVKYCSTDCKIAHRPEHEKNCWKRIVEINDEKTIQRYGGQTDITE